MEGRRVLITGAGIGIGRSTAIRFASAGYHVYVTDVLISEGESVVNEILESSTSSTEVLVNEVSGFDPFSFFKDLFKIN